MKKGTEVNNLKPIQCQSIMIVKNVFFKLNVHNSLLN